MNILLFERIKFGLAGRVILAKLGTITLFEMLNK